MDGIDLSIVKHCSKCKITKLLCYFNKDKRRKDGKFPYCKDCSRSHTKEMYQKHKEKRVEDSKYQYQINKQAYKERAKVWSSKNREKRSEISRRYVENNPEKRYVTQQGHRRRNAGVYAANYKKRQQAKRQAVPLWANLSAIEAMYIECARITKETGIKHHVDHYYPLINKIVCGLHVETNLRIIPAKDNLSKGNNFPTEG